LLEALFPDGLDQLPRLSKPSHQAYTLNALAQGYQLSGQPGRATSLYRLDIEICIREEDKGNAPVALCNLSNALRLVGALRESESASRRALVITREQSDRFQEAVSLNWLGLTLAARGIARESESALQRSLRIFVALSHTQFQGVTNSYLAQRALWLGNFDAALLLADRAWELAHDARYERDFIRAARLQGAAALGLGDFTKADERLHHALTRARAVNLVEEDQQALVALAELRRRQKDLKAARELLDDVWELSERGPYPLFHADAFNVLAQIERDAGNHAAAVDAATKAYRLAWCDGEPYAYHWGLVAARKHLRELGAPEPQMPPFDESKYEPMPEVEINPHDEFYVEEDEKSKDER
jgi:tetratricopeptide (TPR) repeat protein